MPRKPKFKPVITRVKLNPEQAVLSCNCYSIGTLSSGVFWKGGTSTTMLCTGIRSGWPNHPVCVGTGTRLTNAYTIGSANS